MKYKPVAETNEENHTQKVFKFDNGYGASIVRSKFTHDGSYSTYTSDDTEWELAVLKFSSGDKCSLCYDTPITDDVLGHLKIEDVEKILDTIKELK